MVATKVVRKKAKWRHLGANDQEMNEDFMRSPKLGSLLYSWLFTTF